MSANPEEAKVRHVIAVEHFCCDDKNSDKKDLKGHQHAIGKQSKEYNTRSSSYAKHT